MINLKSLLTSIILLLNLNLSFAQEFKAGLVLPRNDKDWYNEKYCCILSPKEGFSLFEKPNGKKIGILKKKITADEQSKYQIFIYLNSALDQPFDNYKEVGYEIFALTFTDLQNGYIKLSSKKELWLSISEIEKKDFKPIFWKDFLLKQNETVLGFYANEPRLIVRTEPKADSKIIGSCRGDLYEIKLTEKFTGKWGKVKITKYKEHPCETELRESENIETKFEGWIKVIDNNDEPNIYSYTRGC